MGVKSVTARRKDEAVSLVQYSARQWRPQHLKVLDTNTGYNSWEGVKQDSQSRHEDKKLIGGKLGLWLEALVLFLARARNTKKMSVLAPVVSEMIALPCLRNDMTVYLNFRRSSTSSLKDGR